MVNYKSNFPADPQRTGGVDTKEEQSNKSVGDNDETFL